MPDGKSRVFDRCSMTASVNPQKRSFAAMILALQDENWTTKTISAERSTLYAEICYRDDNRYCATVTFRVGERGGVTATPDYVQLKVMDDLDRWFVALERSFNKYRCYTDAVLREETIKYGFAY
jgi:hypothetical protein